MCCCVWLWLIVVQWISSFRHNLSVIDRRKGGKNCSIHYCPYILYLHYTYIHGISSYTVEQPPLALQPVKAGGLCLILTHTTWNAQTSEAIQRYISSLWITTTQCKLLSVSAGFICIYLHLHMQLCTPTTDHHHTVKVARVQVQYLRQWMDEKAPPAQVAEGDATICASGLSALVAE